MKSEEKFEKSVLLAADNGRIYRVNWNEESQSYDEVKDITEEKQANPAIDMLYRVNTTVAAIPPSTDPNHAGAICYLINLKNIGTERWEPKKR